MALLDRSSEVSFENNTVNNASASSTFELLLSPVSFALRIYGRFQTSQRKYIANLSMEHDGL